MGPVNTFFPLVTVALFTWCIGVFIYNIILYWNWHRVQKAGAVMSATITQKEMWWLNNMPRCRIHYEYIFQDREYKCKQRVLLPTYSELEEGIEVEIMFLPQKPEISFLVAEKSVPVRCFLTMGACILAIIVIVCINIYFR